MASDKTSKVIPKKFHKKAVPEEDLEQIAQCICVFPDFFKKWILVGLNQ